MKKQRYLLKIDHPCKQDWTLMATNKGNKFCSHCSKTVTDFTNFTDEKLAKVLEHSSEKICGRLTQQQLNRVLVTPKERSSILQLCKLVSGLLIFGTVENSSAAVNPLPAEIVKTTSIIENKAETEKYTEPTDSVKNLIQGKVIDQQTKEPLPFASVIIKGTKTGVVTDDKGKFKLILPDSFVTSQVILEIMYVGYENTEVKIKSTDLPLTQEFLIAPAGLIMGDIIIVKQRKWWQRKRKN